MVWIYSAWEWPSFSFLLFLFFLFFFFFCCLFFFFCFGIVPLFVFSYSFLPLIALKRTLFSLWLLVGRLITILNWMCTISKCFGQILWVKNISTFCMFEMNCYIHIKWSRELNEWRSEREWVSPNQIYLVVSFLYNVTLVSASESVSILFWITNISHLLPLAIHEQHFLFLIKCVCV